MNPKKLDEASREKLAIKNMNDFDARQKQISAEQAVHNALSSRYGLTIVQLQQKAGLSAVTLNKVLNATDFHCCKDGLYFLK